MRTAAPFTLAEASEAVRRGERSSRDLTEQALEAVGRHDGTLNAVLRLSPQALAEADRLDAEARRGDFRGPLHGVPLLVKDNIDVRGMPTTVGSALFADAPPARADATAVGRLRAAGAIILGKANLDEFAAHVSGITSFFGPTVNPWHPERRLSPGGSSSGTAAAVAAGYCWGGLGTDTGGSTRLPAGWCGLCGLRPSTGRIALSGVYPRAASLDTVGLLARSVQDVEILLGVVAETAGLGALSRSKTSERRRIGVFPELVRTKAASGVADLYARAVERWAALGHTCVPLDLPLLDAPEAAESLNVIRSFEFARDIRDDVETHPLRSKMHPIALADYRQGRALSPEAYAEALRRGAALTQEVDAFFSRWEVDFLLLPVALSTAPALDSPAAVFAAGRTLVNLFSMTGVPTLVVPGETGADGLPLGMQLVGPRLSETLLLRRGMDYERRYGPFPLPDLARIG